MGIAKIPPNKCGMWTVTGRGANRSNGQARWYCSCDCGRTVNALVSGCHLINGRSTMCVLCSTGRDVRYLSKCRAEGVDYNVDGRVFGRLTCLSMSDRRTNDKKLMVWAECSCNGNIKEYNLGSLIRGATKSCRCISKEMAVERWKKFRENKNALRCLSA